MCQNKSQYFLSSQDPWFQREGVEARSSQKLEIVVHCMSASSYLSKRWMQEGPQPALPQGRRFVTTHIKIRVQANGFTFIPMPGQHFLPGFTSQCNPKETLSSIPLDTRSAKIFHTHKKTSQGLNANEVWCQGPTYNLQMMFFE